MKNPIPVRQGQARWAWETGGRVKRGGCEARELGPTRHGVGRGPDRRGAPVLARTDTSRCDWSSVPEWRAARPEAGEAGPAFVRVLEPICPTAGRARRGGLMDSCSCSGCRRNLPPPAPGRSSLGKGSSGHKFTETQYTLSLFKLHEEVT